MKLSHVFALGACSLQGPTLGSDGRRKSPPTVKLKLSEVAKAKPSGELVRFVGKVSPGDRLRCRIQVHGEEDVDRAEEPVEEWEGLVKLRKRITFDLDGSGDFGTWRLEVSVDGEEEVEPLVALLGLRCAMVRADVVDALVDLEPAEPELDFDEDEAPAA